MASEPSGTPELLRRALAVFLPVAVFATLACGLIYVEWSRTVTRHVNRASFARLARHDTPQEYRRGARIGT